MPWWISAYFALYVAFSLWSLVDGLVKREKTISGAALETLFDGLLIVAGLAYWLPSVRGLGEEWLGYVFSLAVAGALLSAYRAVLEQVFDHELSFKGRLFVACSGSLLAVSFSGPLVYWGFKASVLNSYAGT